LKLSSPTAKEGHSATDMSRHELTVLASNEDRCPEDFVEEGQKVWLSDPLLYDSDRQRLV